jgi:Asp-tRNA(Asn)/Glu-tRNA(Gln) amidotransferase A subunit family amidase
MPFAGSAEPEAEAALRRAIHALGKAGATVVDVTLDARFAAAHDAQRTISLFEAAQHLAFEHRRQPEELSAMLRAALDEGRAIPVAEFDAARSTANKARKATHALFEPIDVLLTYSAPGPAPLAETTGDPRFNRLVTLLGLPAVNVPGCRTDDGLPVGLQVVAAFGDDQRALAAASFLEAALAASSAA